MDVSPGGYGARPALLRKGQGTPGLWSQMLLRATSSPPGDMWTHTGVLRAGGDGQEPESGPGAGEPCSSSQLGGEILLKPGQPVNPAASGWSEMQAAGNS